MMSVATANAVPACPDGKEKLSGAGGRYIASVKVWYGLNLSKMFFRIKSIMTKVVAPEMIPSFANFLNLLLLLNKNPIAKG